MDVLTKGHETGMGRRLFLCTKLKYCVKRMISSSHRTLPDKTQHSLQQQKNSYPDEIRTQKFRLHERTAADQRLRPLGYRDQ